MLPADRLALAIDIQTRSYRLLRWLAEAIQKGFIAVRSAHHHAEATDSARDWIEEHYLNLPPAARPDREHFDEFVNFFTTYVTTSFDIELHPGTVRKSDCGCYCSMCSHAVER